MDFETLDHLLSSKPGATPEYPFGPGVRVWKLSNKMFALVGEESEQVQISLKCDPDLALELRAQFPGIVTAGYHLNKTHWNTVILDGTVDHEISDWIDHSYQLVLDSLPQKDRLRIESI